MSNENNSLNNDDYENISNDDNLNEKDEDIFSERKVNDKADKQSVIKFIDELKEKIKEKNDIIKKLRDVLKEDEDLKIRMKEKIDELRDNIDKIQNENNDNNNNELNKLLGKDDENFLNIFADQELKKLEYGNQIIFPIGNALMNDYQTRIFVINKNTCWGRFKYNFNRFLNFLVPFKKDMKFIYSRYDRSVSGLFEVLQYLQMISITMFLVTIYLLIYHLVNYDYVANNDHLLCYSFFPCVIMYSRFSVTDKEKYTITMCFIILFLFITIIYKWSNFKKKNILQSLFDNDETLYSKFFFDSWDWKVNTNSLMEDQKCKINNTFIIGISEKVIKEKIKMRTTSEKLNILLWRIFSLFLTILILCLNAFAVGGLYAGTAYLSYLVTDRTIELVIDLIPGIGIILVYSLSSWLLEKCVSIERWDFNSTKNIQLMWRNYIAKAFTMIVVYLLVINMTMFDKTAEELFSIKDFDFKMTLSCKYDSDMKVSYVSNSNDISSDEVLIPYYKYSNCKEDLAINIIFVNLLVDFLSRKIVPLLIFLLRYIFIKKIKKKENFKESYDLISSSCDILIFYIQMFSLIPIFPFSLILTPIMIIIDFKYEKFILLKIKNKPETGLSMQDKIGYFMITIFSFNILIFNVLFLLYFVYGTENELYLNCYQSGKYTNGPQKCGPFSDKETMKSVFINMLETNLTLKKIFDVLSEPIYLFIIAFILLGIVIYFYKILTTLRFYIREKRKEIRINDKNNNDITKKLKDQLKFFKKQLEIQNNM